MDAIAEVGTFVTCVNKVAYYASSWGFSNTVDGVPGHVEAGDVIRAVVIRTTSFFPFLYTFRFTDLTHPRYSFDVMDQSCPYGGQGSCPAGSAEWVASPTYPPNWVPLPGDEATALADFTPWTVRNAQATSGTTTGPIPVFTSYSVIMTGTESIIRAKPGRLNSTGRQFTDFHYGCC